MDTRSTHSTLLGSRTNRSSTSSRIQMQNSKQNHTLPSSTRSRRRSALHSAERYRCLSSAHQRRKLQGFPALQRHYHSAAESSTALLPSFRIALHEPSRLRSYYPPYACDRMRLRRTLFRRTGFTMPLSSNADRIIHHPRCGRSWGEEWS